MLCSEMPKGGHFASEQLHSCETDINIDAKVAAKSGNANTGVDISAYLRQSKAFYWSTVHRNTCFFSNRINGLLMTAKCCTNFR
jgi:hypothetical protein